MGEHPREMRIGGRHLVRALALAVTAAVLASAAPAWAASPVLVKDIDPGAGNSSPAALTNVNGTLFFAASDGTHGVELWKSDGTAAGTVMVKDINPGGDSNPESLVNVGGTLFFSADDGTHGRELWKSDGTAAGTVMVSDINPGSAASDPFWLTAVGGELLFSADDGSHGDELWRSDGSAGGTVMVKDIYPGASSNPTDLVDVGGTVFFHATENVHGDELWRSDGTSDGTTLVDDINPGSAGSSISELTNVNGTLFFAAFDGTSHSLWKSDGTTAGTTAVKFVGSVPSNLTSAGGTLFFAANDTTDGLELWKSDGTAAGTVMVKDINPGPGSSNPGRLGSIDFNGTLFFGADDGTDGVELWKSDGTDAGTVMVKDINPAGDSSPGRFASFDGQLYFPADDGTHGFELWKTDGTGVGTTLVADINPGANDSFPAGFAEVNGSLFFSADDGTHGRELWSLASGGGPAPTTLTTSQTWQASPGGPRQGASITVPFGATGESDRATITGDNTFIATGRVIFGLYSNSQCTQDSQVFTSTNRVAGGPTPFAVADSDPVSAQLAPGTYYWTAAYSGDNANQGSTSPCGAETLTVASRTSGPAATTVTTSQTWRTSPGPSPQGPSITVPVGATGESDRATITGNNTFMAAGSVSFGLYSNPQCTQDSQVFSSTNRVAGGPTAFAVADSDPVSIRLSAGTYYWTAAYSGDSRNQPSTSPCGAETLTVGGTGRGGIIPVASFAPPRVVRPGAVTTLNAAASQNAVQYQWDLNGDGTPDVTCQTPQVQTQLLAAAAHGAADRAGGHAAAVTRVGLTVVSATGQTSTVTQAVAMPNSTANVMLSPAAASYYRLTQNALCGGAGVVTQAVCVHPVVEYFGVIEARGCLREVTGLGDLTSQDDRELVQRAIKTYNDSPAFVAYANELCEAALLHGDVANCSLRQNLLQKALTSGSIEIFESSSPVQINGLEFIPAYGHPLVISPQLETIFWNGAEIELNGAKLDLPSTAAFSFRDVNVPLTEVVGANDRQSPPLTPNPISLPRRALPGLAGLIPQTATLSFVRGRDRHTQIDASLALPSILKAADGDLATFQARFTVSNEADLQIGHIHGGLQDINFGPIGIEGVAVDYDGTKPELPLLISGKIDFLRAQISFAPDPPNHPQNGILFYGSQFKSAHATLDLPCPTLCPELFPGVTLDSIDAGIEQGPWVISGGGDLNIVDLIDFTSEAAVAFASPDDPWTPNLATPELPELPRSFPAFEALTVAAAGDASLNVPILDGQKLAKGYLVYSYPGYVAFGGSVDWSLLGVVSFSGGLDGQFNAVNKRFNFAGHLQSCVVDVICAGAFGVVSDAGAGACFDLGPVSVGGGVQFPSHVYLWPFDGCKWSRFTEDHVFDGARDIRARGPRAAMRPYIVPIAPGEASRAISIDGDGEAPAVRVTGPGGQDVTSSTGDCTPASDTTYNGSTCLTIVGHIRIMRSPMSHQTVIGLQNPAPGTYTITPLPSSSAFAKVFTASDPASPQITGSVLGTGASRILRYNVRPIPEEKVTFLDVAPQGAREIGTVNGGTGALSFTPAPGDATHFVEAEVEMAGLPVPVLPGGNSGALDVTRARAARAGGSMITIARFRPPRLVHAGAAGRLRVQRHGTVVRISWRKARGALRYVVVLRLGNGDVRTVTVRGTSARITGVPRTEAGQVTVRAIGTDSQPGRATRARFRATAKPRTILRRLP